MRRGIAPLMQLLLQLQLHKAVIPVRLARAPRKAESTTVPRYRTVVGCGSFLLSVPRQHANTGSLPLCCDHPVAATAAFDTPVDAAPAATPVAATVTHAAVACAAVHAAAPHVAACAATCATADAAVAPVAHADVTDVCAFRATPVYEMVPRVTPRIQGGGAGVALPATSTPPERSQCHWFSVFKLIFCLGLQCDGDETVQETVLVHLMGSGAGGTAGRGEGGCWFMPKKKRPNSHGKGLKVHDL